VRYLLRPKNTAFTPHDVNILKLQQSLTDKLGARVIVQHAKSGKGKVVVKYNSLEELEGILAHIK
jgi:ParB family chromosome partitioning protein